MERSEPGDYDLELLLTICDAYERWRRFGVWVMYLPLACLVATVITGIFMWAGGAAPAGGANMQFNLWTIPFMASGCGLLIATLLMPVGMLIRIIAARKIGRTLAPKRVGALPELPFPTVGERVGNHAVLSSTDDALHLSQSRTTIVRALVRALVLLFVSALTIPLVFNVLTGTVAFHPKHALALLAPIGVLAVALRPMSIQWMVVRDSDGAELVIEQYRLFRRRHIVVLQREQIHAFRLIARDGYLFANLELVVRDRNDDDFDLGSVGYGPLGQWKARRIAAFVGRILGLSIPLVDGDGTPVVQYSA